MVEPKDEKSERLRKLIFAVLVIGLLVLRFPMLIIPSFFHTGLPLNTLWLLFLDGTYLLTAILFILERDRLAQFKLNFLAVLIFLIAPTLRLIGYRLWKLKAPMPFWELWFPIIISGLLCIYFIFHFKQLQKENLRYYIKWILLSVLVGSITIIVVSSIENLISPSVRGPIHPSFTIFICSFFVQLSNAAVSEEPLFRGFIWGWLEKRGWKQSWIWLFQAGLFCLGHIYYLPNLSVYFIAVFVHALVLGFLVWKSKSIGTSMIAHGIINSLGDLISHYTW